MARPPLIYISFFVILSCSSEKTKTLSVEQMDYPTKANYKILPTQFHIVGIITEVSHGNCGILCEGGYIKVAIQDNTNTSIFLSAYVITACLSQDVKIGDKVDVIATLHNGQEQECYYKAFDKPRNKNDIAFYKLTESETRKILK